jgi:transposase
VLGAFLAVIDQILEDDRTAPPKQRHTARRIFERLRDEYGYTGGITQVQEAVAQAKRYSKEAFVPLSHPPGHAQFDFGEATVEIAGERCKAHLAVITLPYSDTYFLSAYPRECTETFQAGHLAGFEFFGGVPIRISYDNTSIAVSKIVGRERELTREFLRLESHHLFAHHFCHVRRGNEKGHVETHVGYARRNLLVPVPRFSSFSEMNEYLAACCYADLFRRVRGKPETKAERLEVDQAARGDQVSGLSPVSTRSWATSRSLTLRRCEAWREMLEAWSPVIRSRSMRIPCAWPISSRVTIAASRFLARRSSSSWERAVEQAKQAIDTRSRPLARSTTLKARGL